MIMVSLMGYYIYHVRHQSTLWLMAMICALLGDIFLLFSGREFFMMGLVSFSVMQGLYILYFLRNRSPLRSVFQYLVIAAIIFTGISVGAWLWGYVHELRWSVMMYIVLLCSMSVAAVLRNNRLTHYKMVVYGSMLFIISDVLLAVHTFITPFWGSEPWIMSTYMAAQYMIIRGIVVK